jgi:hypothetical protein
MISKEGRQRPGRGPCVVTNLGNRTSGWEGVLPDTGAAPTMRTVVRARPRRVGRWPPTASRRSGLVGSGPRSSS